MLYLYWGLGFMSPPVFIVINSNGLRAAGGKKIVDCEKTNMP